MNHKHANIFHKITENACDNVDLLAGRIIKNVVTLLEKAKKGKKGKKAFKRRIYLALK